MLDSAEIVFIVIFALEVAAIITGNVFTIIVFWTQRTHLKRAYFLLINLAVADLLVGVTETISLGTEKVLKMKAVRMEDVDRIKNPLLAFQLLGSSTSERAHAVLRPLRHRVITTRVYICAIVIAWAVGLCIAGTYLLATYHKEVDRVYVFVAIHLFLFMFVLIIFASYLTVHSP